jgi:hypothetical protein
MLLRKIEGKKPFEIPRHRWKDHVGMDIKEITS